MVFKQGVKKSNSAVKTGSSAGWDCSCPVKRLYCPHVEDRKEVYI
jgi:hypothetical protein